MMPAFSALVRVLDELGAVVAVMTDHDYRAAAGAGVSGSIGAHVRHCLDHVLALEEGLRSRTIDYDHRVRGTAVEHDRQAALTALREAAERLSALDDRWLPGLIQVRAQLTHAARPRMLRSTIGRELAFVISHTIHHCATIHALLERRAHRLPARFGLAPATPALVGPHVHG